MGRTSPGLTAYSDFLLGEYDSAVLSPNANGGDIGGSDGLERIFCGAPGVSSYDGMSSAIKARLAWNHDEVQCTYRLDTIDPGRRR